MDNPDVPGSSGSGSQQSRKRSFEQMSGQSRETTPSRVRTRISEPSSQQSASIRFSRPPSRFPGDGLDLRRPVMSTRASSGGVPNPSAADVIDLTDDIEPPTTIHTRADNLLDSRSERYQIGYQQRHSARRDGNFERPAVAAGPRDDNQQRSRSNSPEVHFLYERNVERTRRTPSHTERASRPPPNRQHPPGVLPSSRSVRTQHNHWGWLPLPSPFRYLTDAFSARAPTDPSFYSRRGGRNTSDRSTELRLQAYFESVRFQAPQLNFESAAFALNPEPPSPTYEKPPAPRDGFLRSPQEEDVLICPNCGDELGNSEDELKQQVWVVKACGHVYCGECARNRSKRGKVRDARLPNPFSKCVVDGCEKTKVSHHKAMFQLYVT